ncbi:MAG: SRPBCC family protein, partial [Flavobacteriales bacterium]|nr:SRPBCC family protein [Flavobacteriales bacterium]
MKFLKVLLVIVLVVVVGAGILIATRAGSYDVERSVVIDGCEADVALYATDYRKWEDWTPWADPSQTDYVYSDEQSAEGAWYTWDSPADSVGSGKVTTTQFEEGTMLFDLDFSKPFESHSTGHVKWEEVEGGLKVSWGSQGELPIMARLFVDAEDVGNDIGDSFDEGLAKLKTIVEGLEAPSIVPEERAMEPFSYIGKRFQMNMSELSSELYAETFGAIAVHCMNNGIEFHPDLMPMAMFYSFDQETYDADMELAIPVTGEATAPEGFTV